MAEAPLPFAWGVLYAKPNPDGTAKRCDSCIMWSRDEKCSIHAKSLQVCPSAVCIPPDALVFVDGDILRADEVKPGSLLLTHRNRWRKVKEVMKREYSGDLIRIKPKGLSPILLTPEHPIFVIRRRSKWDNAAQRNWIPSPYRDVFEPEWIAAQDLKVSDIILTASPQEQPEESVGVELFDRLIEVTPDLARFFGYYLAEGCACRDGRIPFVFAN